MAGPVVSAGLFCAVDRLRTYCDEELRELARALNRVASRARLDEKVTTEWRRWVYIFSSEAGGAVERRGYRHGRRRQRA